MEDFGVGLQHCKQKKKKLIDDEEEGAHTINVLTQISRAQVKHRGSMTV